MQYVEEGSSNHIAEIAWIIKGSPLCKRGEGEWVNKTGWGWGKTTS